MTHLSFKGYGLPKDDFDEADIHDILNELTVSPVSIMSAPVPKYKLFLQNSKKIYVPKFYGLSKFGLPSKNSLPDGQDIHLPFVGDLRIEQMDPVSTFIKVANDPLKMGGILNIPCGGGKTVIALKIISLLGKKTLIIVHKDFLLEQWNERISQFLPSANIGIIKGKHTRIDRCDIVIASLQSLSMKTYDPSIFECFGLVVIDEVHRTGTEIFSNALHKVNFKYSLGLSATTTRKDGLSKVFKWFIGDIVYKKKREKENVIVNCVNYEDDDEEYCRHEYMFQSRLNTSKMLNNICSCSNRNDRIVDIIHQLGPNRKVLVLSDRKKQLEYIANHLNVTNGYYIGGMSADALKLSEAKQVILATFSFASEGFDAKGLDTLILASPKTDIEQSVGRILRQKESDRINTPMVFDIIDNFSIFINQAKKRKTYYRKNGFVIENETQHNRQQLDLGTECLIL